VEIPEHAHHAAVVRGVVVHGAALGVRRRLGRGVATERQDERERGGGRPGSDAVR
jgi:hypothetical protein